MKGEVGALSRNEVADTQFCEGSLKKLFDGFGKGCGQNIIDSEANKPEGEKRVMSGQTLWSCGAVGVRNTLRMLCL